MIRMQKVRAEEVLRKHFPIMQKMVEEFLRISYLTLERFAHKALREILI